MNVKKFIDEYEQTREMTGFDMWDEAEALLSRACENMSGDELTQVAKYFEGEMHYQYMLKALDSAVLKGSAEAKKYA